MSNRWEVKPTISVDFVRQFPEYDKIVLQLLANRNITDRQDIENFFHPDEAELSDPFLFEDMRAAAELIIKHIKEQNLIVVYGDYDADGVTATAVLWEALNILKAKAAVYIPARISEGYGLNKKAIDELQKKGAKLIITVDNGIRNKAEVEYARGLGLDIIVTDHHEAPLKREDWPDCLIINPKAGNYPFKMLAGVGVAFKLAQALITSSKLGGELKRKLAEKILDLVAVGTVADMVDLVAENRALVSRGLKVLNRRKRLGLKELIKISQGQTREEKQIKAWQIGWQLGPRLNSAGRLDHANTAYELLVTKDKTEAVSIAKRLNEKNQERQRITEEIFLAAKKMVVGAAGQPSMLEDKILVVVCPDGDESGKKSWPEGVMGLVAGRFCEEYWRPALVITKFKGEIKGSGRSIEEFNIIKAVEKLSQHLERFGGHAAACGFTVKSEKDLLEFSEKIKALAAAELAGAELRPELLIEAEIDLPEINNELVEALERFEPFGEANERPKFLSRDLVIMDKISMGADGRHIKFRFGQFWAVAFGQAENFKDFKIGDRVDLVYYLEFNEFNGRRAAQMKVVDMKLFNTNITN